MAKYEFEWTDEQAEMIQGFMLSPAAQEGIRYLLYRSVAQRIEEQKPIPLPTKRLAMIRGKASGLEFVVLSCTRVDGGADWYGPVNGNNLGGWVEREELPTDFEVLFEGVDL